MEGCKIISSLIFLIFVYMLKIGNALPVELHENEASISTTEANKEVPDMSELVKIQPETIQKMLTSQAVSGQDQNSRKNCDDIESSIKETLTKITEGESKKEAEKQDIDLDTEASEISIRENDRRSDLVPENSVSEERVNEVASEKSAVPNGRTLFTYYPVDKKPATEVHNVTTSTVTTVTEESRSFTERPNIILIPCMKKMVVDEPQALSEESTRRLFDSVNANQQIQNQNVQIHLSTDKPVTVATGNPELPQGLVLEKIYSPTGQFLYYMYRLRNVNPVKEVITTVPPPTTTKATTTKSSTTTTTTSTITTSKPIPEPVYAEQMKFVVRLPLTDPEPLSRYPWKFDNFAYYPKDLRPAYINAPVPYSPMFHMIRTLAIPNDDGQYVLKDPLNPTLENVK